MRFLILLFTFLINLSLFSYQGTIDTVYNFKIGLLDFQDSINAYYPFNIYGLPSSKASEIVPESSPEQILSIGIGGEIIVGFKNYILKDGNGFDFIIFENAFINPVNKGIFAEPAIISVSSDGINYIEFPYDSITLSGLAGITPTIGKGNPYNYPEGGGDGFDLSAIGADKIKYIKITDISEIVSNLDKNNKYYNPKFILSGFDLDAVLGLHLESLTDVSEIGSLNSSSIRFDNYLNQLEFNNPENSHVNLKVFSLEGKVLYNKSFEGSITINFESLSGGFYLTRITGKNGIINYKFIKH